MAGPWVIEPVVQVRASWRDVRHAMRARCVRIVGVDTSTTIGEPRAGYVCAGRTSFRSFSSW
jgi:hypothetical protein